MARESSNVRSVVFAVFSLLAVVGILAWLLSHVSLKDALELIANASASGIAVFVVLSLATSFYRMWRYLLLLGATGYAPRRWPLFLVVLVRNLFADLLPARLGTLVYIFLATTRLAIPIGAATSSFALSFLFDILALAPVAFVFVLAASDVIPASGLAVGAVVLAIITAVLILILPRLFALGAWFLRALGWTKLETVFVECLGDIKKTKELGIYDRVLSVSVMVRLGKYATLYMFLYALLHPMGYGFQELVPSKVFVGLCSAELAASLPAGTIAGFGAPQGAWALTFQLLGFPAEIAKLTSVSHILFTQLWGYSLGLIALVILTAPSAVRYLSRKSQDSQPDLVSAQPALAVGSLPMGSRTSFYLRFALSVVATLVLACLAFTFFD